MWKICFELSVVYFFFLKEKAAILNIVAQLESSTTQTFTESLSKAPSWWKNWAILNVGEHGAVWMKCESVAKHIYKNGWKQMVIKFCAKTLVLDLMLVSPAGCLWNCGLVKNCWDLWRSFLCACVCKMPIRTIVISQCHTSSPHPFSSPSIMHLSIYPSIIINAHK